MIFFLLKYTTQFIKLPYTYKVIILPKNKMKLPKSFMFKMVLIQIPEKIRKF